MSFLGCFLSSLLHAKMADLFEPVSSASTHSLSTVLHRVWIDGP